MDIKKPVHSYINIKDRKCISLDGVINIERFDEKCVSLLSEAGKIEIEGENLKIESLSKDDGTIVVNGSIEGVYYCKEKFDQGFFKRLFG